jgi:hypothetical protein
LPLLGEPLGWTGSICNIPPVATIRIRGPLARVVVEMRQHLPTLVLLAAHASLASLPLGVEGVELLFEPFLL